VLDFCCNPSTGVKTPVVSLVGARLLGVGCWRSSDDEWDSVEQMLSQQKRDYTILHPEQVRPTHMLPFVSLTDYSCQLWLQDSLFIAGIKAWEYNAGVSVVWCLLLLLLLLLLLRTMSEVWLSRC
jgi:hypothetical protein